MHTLEVEAVVEVEDSVSQRFSTGEEAVFMGGRWDPEVLSLYSLLWTLFELLNSMLWYSLI